MRLNDAATNLLAVVVQAFADAGVDLPERQYVTFGEVADKCEQAVVSWADLSAGLAGSPVSVPQNCVTMQAGTFEVRIIRCVPLLDDDGSGPTSAALTASGAQIMDDAVILRAGLLKADKDHSLHGGEEGPRAVISPVRPVSRQGRFGGVTATVILDVNAFTAEPS